MNEKRFLEDVANHEMIVIRNNGINRHLRFRRPDTITDWFDLVTWSGYLCITGDYGTFVFSRITDMFEFFRTSKNYRKNNPETKIHINPQYWAEKVQSETVPDGIEKFSASKFENAVKDYFDLYFEDSQDDDEKQTVWKNIESEVLCYSDNEHEAFSAVHEFQHNNFQFEDFFEYNLNEYTFYYLWCLHAIVWGISQFDALADI